MRATRGLYMVVPELELCIADSDLARGYDLTCSEAYTTVFSSHAARLRL
jgi:hypothetical protein